MYEHLRPNDLTFSAPPDCVVTTASDSLLNSSTKHFSRSASNLAPPVDSVSPSALSSEAAPTAALPRNRSTTFNKLTRYLRSSVSSGGGGGAGGSAATTANNVTKDPSDLPQIHISTKSLPDSLTSANPSILNCCPTSSSSTSRHQVVDQNGTSDFTPAITSAVDVPANELTAIGKSRSWKLPKYLRKFENRNNNNSVKCDSVKCVINDGAPSTVNAAATTTTTAAENGQSYQLLPIIIQKSSADTSVSPSVVDDTTAERENQFSSTPSCSPSPRSLVNPDIIDVRSYISQSRSDITRSQQRPYYGEVSPMRRPRASTLALTSQEHISSRTTLGESCGNAVGNELKVPNANAPFFRKTSHHCSPSAPMTMTNHLRLPDVTAANRTSISQERLSTMDVGSWVSNISDDPISMEHSSTIAIPTKNDKYMDPSRKQSDLQLIRCVRDNAKSQQSYLVQPPLSKLTLFFLSPLMEHEFRAKAHQFNTRCGAITIATPIYNTYIDIFIGIVIYSTVSTAMFLLSASHRFNDTPFKWLWFSMFGVFSAVELFALIVFTKKLFRKQRHKKSCSLPASSSLATSIPMDMTHDEQAATAPATASTSSSSINSTPAISCQGNNYLEDKIIGTISTWYKWHICLGILMSLPAILTLVHYVIKNVTHDVAIFEYHYGFLMLVCIVHYCNFTQLNCWMRNILAVLVALAFIGGMSMHHINWHAFGAINGTSLRPSPNNEVFPTLVSPRRMSLFQSDDSPISVNATHSQNGDFHFNLKIDLEIYLDLFLILLLVWFLNREFEIFYRFAFYGSAIAEKDKVRVQTMKNQADLLLQNIIPKHVADHLKNTAKYSENHHNVAIIFASLVNFNELYDESYLGGREYLRVLNELIGDFDELLSRKEFACVEKIKTIGSTFMAASGLDNYYRDDESNNHVNALMEFALAMQDVVAAFNKDLLEFDLILRIGFNVGDVTAGVIGTSKLHYDIWGDAVNVSSRMDSTGVPGCIQCGKDCIPFLSEERYEFEPRGKVFVKGKDNMEVYLVKRKRLDT